MRETELTRIREAAARVFPGSGVFLAYAYGSRISGNPRPRSDLDVGYYLHREQGAEELPLSEEMGLSARLTLETGHDVDFRCLQHAPLDLRARAMIDGERIYCSDDAARPGFESLILRRYYDQKSVLEKMHQDRINAMAEEFADHGG
jgi:predicted nucleotidyltransferase